MTTFPVLAAESPLASIDIVIVIFYMVAVLILGVYFGRSIKSSGDFFLAGRSLPFWAIGMSIVVSDIGAMDMISGAGAAYKYGLAQANFDWLGSVPALVLVAFLFVPFYWRTGVSTLPEFFGKRFGPVVRVFQAVIWLGFMITMLAAMLWLSAVFLTSIMGWPTQTAIWVTVAVVGVYTVMGGLTAVVLTDVIQMVIMFVGAGALLGLSFWKIGGWSNLVETVSAQPGYQDHFQLLLPHDTTSPYPWSGMLLGLGVVLSTAYFSSNQTVVQRALGARSEWHAKAAFLFAALLKLMIPVLIIVPGLAALAITPGLEDPDQAVPSLIGTLLPPGLRGLVFASFFAALMSSVDSYLNSSTTILVSDGYQTGFRLFRGTEPSTESCLWLGRIITVLLIIGAGLVAPTFDRFESIYVLTQTVLSFFQGPTLAVLLMGILWKRANRWGGTLGMILGVVCSSVLRMVGDNVFPPGDPFLFIAFWSFVFSIVVIVVASLVTPPPREEDVRGLTIGDIVRKPSTVDPS